MNRYTLREYLPGDAADLTRLWQQVFGDPQELIETFLRLLPGLGTGVTALCDGQPVGAAYAIDAMGLADSAGASRRCAYIYAVAVRQDHRHQGLGRQLCQNAAELARQRGASILCTLPAEESLYAWYHEILGLDCALRRRVNTAASQAGFPCEKLCAEDYLARREALLAGRPHLCPAPVLMDFAGTFYACFGGGLYACGGGLLAAYADRDTLIIKELIAPAGITPESIAASAGAALGFDVVRYYLPSESGEAYIAAVPGVLPGDCVWNLSFD